MEKFRLLQRAKDILTDESSRKSYDRWLNSGINIPFEQWQGKKGHSMHWAPPRSTKLCIVEGSSIGQGSEYNVNNGTDPVKEENWLDKFRKYEI